MLGVVLALAGEIGLAGIWASGGSRWFLVVAVAALAVKMELLALTTPNCPP